MEESAEPRPKRRVRRKFELTPEHEQILRTIGRLRTVTIEQAYWLCAPFRRINSEDRLGATKKPKSLSAAKQRLKVLADHGYLEKQPVNERRGAFTGSFYQLGWKALRTLHADKAAPRLLARPSAPMLAYLLFRNEVFAEARRAGWFVASPVLVTPESEARFLKQFRVWVEAELQRKLAAVEGRSAADAMRVKAELDRLDQFVPKQLTWDFLMRFDARGQPTDYVVLGVDDPRVSVTKQVALVPILGLERARLLIRDSESRYDTTKREVYFESTRLMAWRRAAQRRLGEQLVAEDLANTRLAPEVPGALFPDLWAKKIASYSAFPSAPSDAGGTAE